jgi:hypothetical protein
VGSPDADVVEAAGVAEGDHPGGVDAIAADPVVAIGVSAGRGGGLGTRQVGDRGGGSLGQGAVRSAVVVGVEEAPCRSAIVVGWSGSAACPH